MPFILGFQLFCPFWGYNRISAERRTPLKNQDATPNQIIIIYDIHMNYSCSISHYSRLKSMNPH